MGSYPSSCAEGIAPIYKNILASDDMADIHFFHNGSVLLSGIALCRPLYSAASRTGAVHLDSITFCRNFFSYFLVSISVLPKYDRSGPVQHPPALRYASTSGCG